MGVVRVLSTSIGPGSIGGGGGGGTAIGLRNLN